MDKNQIPTAGMSIINTSVTSDGQGHYVVYHEPPPPPVPPMVIQSQQFPEIHRRQPQSQQTHIPQLTPIVVKTMPPPTTSHHSNFSGVMTRPRILTRPPLTTNFASGTAVTISHSPKTSDGIMRLAKSSSTFVHQQQQNAFSTPTNSPISHQQLQMHSPQIVHNQTFPTITATTIGDNSLTLYAADNRTGGNDTVLATGTAVSSSGTYTTISAMENYNMNNIYVEPLQGNVDSSNTVLMTADNQLFNIQNSGTVLLCPSNGEGGINLVPIIDSGDPSLSGGQIQFPLGEVVGGNGIFELITLPSDSTITQLGDQSIISFPSGTSFGNIVSMAQSEQPPQQLVYTGTDEAHQKINISSSSGPLNYQNAPVTIRLGESNSYPTPAPSGKIQTPQLTTMPFLTSVSGTGNGLNSQSISTPSTTNVTLVNDFSDLIKTPLCVRNSARSVDNRRSSIQSCLSDITIQPSDMTKSRIVPDQTNTQTLNGGDDEGVLIIDEYFPESKSNIFKSTPSSTPAKSLVSHLPTKINNIQIVQVIPKAKPMIPKPAPPRPTTTRPLPALNAIRKPPAKRPVQLFAKTLFVTKDKPNPSVFSTTRLPSMQSSLDKFTTLTLRKSMNKLDLANLTVKFIDGSDRSELGKRFKPLAPKEPPIPFHIMHGLSKPVKSVIWNGGLGTVLGIDAKFHVNETSGLFETVDYNVIANQRRIPLKTSKEENKVTVDKEKIWLKPRMFNKMNGPTYEALDGDLKLIKMETDSTPSYSSDDEAVAEINGKLSEDEKDVELCTSCGIVASDEVEFNGRRCKKCFDTQKSDDDISPSTRYKIPKGTTIMKTTKPLDSNDNSGSTNTKTKKLMKVKSAPNISTSDVVYAKKSNPKLDQPVPDSAGIKVVPILQTVSTVDEIDNDPPKSLLPETLPTPSNPKKRKYKRSTVDKKKKKKASQDSHRKRSFETVLSTKSSYVKKRESCSASSASDEKSHGTVSDSDEPSTKDEGNVSSSSESKKSHHDFNWSKYLQETNSKSASPRYFRQPAFPGSNPFKEGMLLEAVDPQHQSLICVASVADIQGFRLRLHLAGYSELFDFWVNADSYEIFPPGWCEEHGYKLDPPAGIESFNWHKYLVDEQLIPAERDFFAISKEPIVPPQNISIGMKLEAVDIRNMQLTCVATVENVINDRILIHFDSWDCVYDYWTDTTSPYIHPVGHCKKNNNELTGPRNWKGPFCWDSYLKETETTAVPNQFFRPLPPIGLKKGMKLECVDKRNPFLIRVATIADVMDHQLIIHFDGWSDDYDYKLYECSDDIHPVGWCAATGHHLQTPPNDKEPWTGSCSVFGCLGLGHMKGMKFLTHNTDINCPYSSANLKKDWTDLLPDRFASYRKSVQVAQQHETAASSRRSSIDSETTTFAKAVKLRAAKRKSEQGESLLPLVPTKRKYTKRKSEPTPSPSPSPADSRRSSIHEEEGVAESQQRESVSLLHSRLTGNSSKTNAILPSLTRTGRIVKMSPLSIEHVPAPVVSKPMILPNIESTITPVGAPASATIACTGGSIKLQWDDIIDSVVKDALMRRIDDNPLPEFTLPSSTTMTPIPMPVPVVSTSSEMLLTKTPADQLLMLCSQKSGGELTISTCINEDSSEPILVGSSSPNQNESDSDLPPNCGQNIEFLQELVGNLNQATVSKWKTNDVVAFIKKIPGCLNASTLFDEHKIDGEAFLLMNIADFSDILGLKMGPCIKLCQGIRLIQKNSNNGTYPILPQPSLPAVSITPIPPTTTST